MNKPTKISKVLVYLQAGYTITQREAIQFFDYYRLSDGIYKLRKRGWNIITEMVTEGDATFARYRLEAGNDNS